MVHQKAGSEALNMRWKPSNKIYKKQQSDMFKHSATFHSFHLVSHHTRLNVQKKKILKSSNWSLCYSLDHLLVNVMLKTSEKSDLCITHRN